MQYSSPDERATIQEEIPLEKIPPTEKATVPEAASIKLDAPSDTAEVEATSLIESPPSGIDSKGSNIQIGDNPPNSLLPNMSPDNPMASILIILSPTKPSVLRFLCRMVKPKTPWRDSKIVAGVKSSGYFRFGVRKPAPYQT